MTPETGGPATRGESPGYHAIAEQIARICADKAAAEFERGFFTGSMLRDDFPNWSVRTFLKFRP